MKSEDPVFDFDNRITSRTHSDLEAVVKLKDSEDSGWKEVTKVTTVSRNGAGFSLSHECSVGRLLTIVLPMPREFRAYDIDADLYPVMGIVQNCYRATENDKIVYHVGVGFIGKVVPESFRSDPRQNYRIEGMRSDGMWQVVEADRPFKSRRHPRIWVRIPVMITLLKQDTKTALRESTFTQNVASSGVSIESALDAKVGDKVKVGCPTLDFYGLAVVRNRKIEKNKPPTTHLEFIDHSFPMEKITHGEGDPKPA